MLKYTLFTVYLCLTIPALLLAEPLVIDKGFTSTAIGKQYQYREDRSGKLTIHDIISDRGTMAGQWIKGEKDALTRGYTSSAYWLRFTIQNISDRGMELYIQQTYPLLNYISFHYPAGDGSYSTIESGTKYVFSHRPVNHRTFVFPVTIGAKSSENLYMRISSEGTMNASLMVYRPSEFIRAYVKESIILWMFYGMLIIMMFYNLIIFFTIKEESYLYYVLYIILFILMDFSLNGYASQFLWPDMIWWGIMCRPVLLGLIVAALCQFARSFINTRHHAKKADRFFMVLIAISLLSSASVFAADSYRFSMLSTMFLAWFSIFSSLCITVYLALFRKSRQAVIFLASFSFFFIGTLLYLLKSLGFIIESPLNNYSILAGAVIQATIFSLGLGDQIKTLKDDLQSLNLRAIGSAAKKKRIISGAIKEKMIRAISYLEDNYRSDISREGLAAHLDINSDDLGRYFKLYTGKKINDYCNELRIEEAAKVMSETDKPITEIAFLVGFESLTTFNRTFQKVMNMTPTNYKEKAKKY